MPRWVLPKSIVVAMASCCTCHLIKQCQKQAVTQTRTHTSKSVRLWNELFGFLRACTQHTFVPHTHPLTKHKHWLHFPRNLLLLVVFICMLKVDHNWNSSLPFVSVSAPFSADFTMACICSDNFLLNIRDTMFYLNRQAGKLK